MITTPNTPANGAQTLTDERIAEIAGRVDSRVFHADWYREFARLIEADLRAFLAAVPASEPVAPDADALIKWIELGCPGVDLMSNRRIMSNHIRALARLAAPGPEAPTDGTLHDAVIRACTVMPESCLIRIEVGKGVWAVGWEDQAGNATMIDGEGNLVDEVRAAISLALAAPAPVSGMPDLAKSEAGWLIEKGDPSAPMYRTIELGMYEWTLDNMKAIRFCRRTDADMFAAEDPENVRICEHVWMGDLPSPQAPDSPVAPKCQSCNGAGVIGTPGMKCPFCPVAAPLPAAPAPTEQAGLEHAMVEEFWTAYNDATATRSMPESTTIALRAAMRVAAVPVAEQAGELPPLPAYELVLIKQYMVGNYLSVYRGFQMQDHARAAYAMGRGSAVRDYVSLNDAALAARQAPTEAPNFGPIGFGLTDRQVLLETADLLMERNWRGDLAETLRDMARQAPDSRDAARYRWLRDQWDGTHNWQSMETLRDGGADMDAAIDAAIVAQEKGK